MELTLHPRKWRVPVRKNDGTLKFLRLPHDLCILAANQTFKTADYDQPLIVPEEKQILELPTRRKKRDKDPETERVKREDAIRKRRETMAENQEKKEQESKRRKAEREQTQSRQTRQGSRRARE